MTSQVGEVINPEEIMSTALEKNMIIKASSNVPYDEYLREDPPVYHRHVSR